MEKVRVRIDPRIERLIDSASEHRKKLLKLIALRQELIASAMHESSKKIKEDEAFVEWDGRSLGRLRHAYHLAVSEKVRKREAEFGVLVASTDDDWETFSFKMGPTGGDRELHLNTQYAKYLIQYLVPQLHINANTVPKYMSSVLYSWEE